MSKSNVWMSVSDLMTGLMVIFLFVAISYMVEVQKNQSVIVDYQDTKNKLHERLVSEFAGDTALWKMSIGKDLSLKFNDPTVLFESGEKELTPKFKRILDDFPPRYFDILLHDTLRDRIQEIRIEGHTDDVPAPRYDPDPYIGNVILSQGRALSVIKYYRNMPSFQQYSDEEQKQIEFWLTANGLSYGKALDDDGNYVKLSGKPINRELSRRVEIRIVTDGDKIIENWLKQKEKGLF